MPAPQKTTLPAIVAAGRDLLEREGVDGLSMHGVADAVGVRPPSLYKHVRDRRRLRELVIGAILQDLADRMDALRDPDDPRRSIRRQLDGLRRFAHAHPAGFALVFSAPDAAPDTAAIGRSAAALLADAAAIVGEEHALDAARLVTAWANGFIGMELGGAFRLSGDPGGAWEWGLERIVSALG